MLTFLFALAAIWTLFWLIMYMLDWGNTNTSSNSKAICSVCANAAARGTSANNKFASNPANGHAARATSGSNAKPASSASATRSTTDQSASTDRKPNPTLGSNADTKEKADAAAQVKAAREEARAEAARTANAAARLSAVKKPVADQHDQANVKPLFKAPNEKDDLKEIKGIGVVMEKTLNDLGITTFKQLAGFKQADVTMVSEALDASNSGFGDRINRDEWVDQAKVLSKKAS